MTPVSTSRQSTPTRASLGAFATPAFLVDHLLNLVEIERAPRDATLIDPACGDGAFLARAAARWRRGDPSLAAVDIARRIHGVDVDPIAVDACRAAVVAALGDDARVREVVGRQVVVGDALLSSDLATRQFDFVVGNPPFRGRLNKRTAPDREYVQRLRERFGEVAGGYADLASVFLALAVDLARPSGGRVAFVMPSSFLGARDGQAARRHALGRAAITHLWWSDDTSLFDDAHVAVCALVLERDTDTTAIARSVGRPPRDVEAVDAAPGVASATTWTHLRGGVAGVPAFSIDGRGTIGDHATVTADFRDQYYGLAPFVVDRVAASARHVALITAGSIDPLWSRWGVRPTRFHRVDYAAPTIDLVAMRRVAPSLGAWAERRLVPKALVATQTRVVECLPDPSGRLLPSVPVISVVPAPDRVWHIAAAIGAPAISALAFTRHRGNALSPDAIKLSARQVAALPAPSDDAAWRRAAELATRAASGSIDDLRGYAVAANAAYGVHDDAVVDWWFARLPRR